MTRQRPLVLLTIAVLGTAALAFGPVTAQQGSPARHASARHQLQGAGLDLQQDHRRRVSRRRHRQPGGDVERHHHRRRSRRAGRRFAGVARRRVGAARRAEGHHAEAHSLGRQLALSLRSLARKPDLRARGGDHRPRVRAPADPRRQVAGLTRPRVLRRRRARRDQGPRAAPGRRDRRQDTRHHPEPARHPAQSPRGHQRGEADAADA